MPGISTAILVPLPKPSLGWKSRETRGDQRRARCPVWDSPWSAAGAGHKSERPRDGKEGCQEPRRCPASAARGQPRGDIKPPLANPRPSPAWHSGQRHHAGLGKIWTPEMVESHLPRAFYTSSITASCAAVGVCVCVCVQGSAAVAAVSPSETSESGILLSDLRNSHEEDWDTAKTSH